MSERTESIGQRETLRHIAKRLRAEIASHRESIRAALPLAGEAEDIDPDYILALVLGISEKVRELKGILKKIAILDEELGDA